MEENKLITPVLFIIFNRPDTTQIVFDEIKKAKPARLFVSADGARSGNKNHSQCRNGLHPFMVRKKLFKHRSCTCPDDTDKRTKEEYINRI